jgi:hypothetical protein
MSNSQTILGETFENTKLLVIFAILAIVNLIGFSIKDHNFKICYWLSVALILITVINLNMSVGFYIRLRSDKGVSGNRGKRGDKGPTGFPGRCELNLEAKCGVKNCISKIQDQLSKRCNHYAEIVAKRDYDRTVEEQQILDKYKTWINIINKQCSKHQGNESDFFDTIFGDSEKYCMN